MHADLRDRWCAALRSGTYQQGRHYLCDNNNYCCLGVLASLEGDLDPDAVTLTELLCDKYKLTGDNVHDLISRNDGICGVVQHTFPEIADWIEANL